MPRTSCWSSGREGIAHLGLLDFQDALAGHPAYDLASVLEDARRDVPPEVERAMIDRYIAATGHGRSASSAPIGRSRRSATPASSASSRRLWKRDGKPGYRRFQPRMWGLLERDLAARTGAGRAGSTPTCRRGPRRRLGGRPNDAPPAPCAPPEVAPRCRAPRW
jgi:hypothetical protein